MHNEKPYHHGNLRQSLITSALDIIEQDGLEQLSMRTLSDKIGVSRSALYHHFKNKNDLLAAIAEHGFDRLNTMMERYGPTEQRQLGHIEEAILDYLKFATEHPAQYGLMFGKTLWQSDGETAFQRHAKSCFKQFVALFDALQKQGHLNTQEPPLMLAQIIWSSLHGIATLTNDSVLAANSDLPVLAKHLCERFK